MNLFMRQNQEHREQTSGCQGEEGWKRVKLGFCFSQFCIIYTYMQTDIYRMYRKQGLTILHREVYSTSCDKPKWKKHAKECIYMYN